MRCKEAHKTTDKQGLFGIVQGGMFTNLRQESLDALVAMDFPGYAVGGVSVGEPKDEMLDIMAHTPHRLPAHKPRYLMGVGTPEDLVEGVACGVDMFDCVMPSRNARHATLFTWKGVMHVTNKCYETDSRPIDEECDCPVCRNFSRSYVRHLFKAGEMLGGRLAVMHNLYFYNTLMEKIRDAIDGGYFDKFRNKYSELLSVRL